MHCYPINAFSRREKERSVPLRPVWKALRSALRRYIGQYACAEQGLWDSSDTDEFFMTIHGDLGVLAVDKVFLASLAAKVILFTIQFPTGEAP
jgi:hypothetical protein